MKNEQIPGLAEAEAQLAAATEKRAGLAERLGKAKSLLADATRQRQNTIERISAGEAVAAEEADAADHRIAEIKREIQRTTDALALPDADIKKAHARIASARRRHALRAFIRVAKDRIALAEEADELTALMSSFMQRWSQNEIDVHAAMNLSGRHSPELMASLGNRYDLIAYIPRGLQNIVAQVGSATAYSVSERQKSVWSRGIMVLQREIDEAG